MPAVAPSRAAPERVGAEHRPARVFVALGHAPNDPSGRTLCRVASWNSGRVWRIGESQRPLTFGSLPGPKGSNLYRAEALTRRVNEAVNKLPPPPPA